MEFTGDPKHLLQLNCNKTFFLGLQGLKWGIEYYQTANCFFDSGKILILDHIEKVSAQTKLRFQQSKASAYIEFSKFLAQSIYMPLQISLKIEIDEGDTEQCTKSFSEIAVPEENLYFRHELSTRVLQCHL